MTRFVSTVVGAVAATTGLAVAQEIATNVVPFDADSIQYAGVFDAATGRFVAPASNARGGAGLGELIYANNSLPGSFYDIEAGDGGMIIDEGRVPGPTSTTVVGTQNSYALSSLQFAYVTNATDPTMGGTGVTIQINLYERYSVCTGLDVTDAPIAEIVLPGLAGSTTGSLAGHLLDVDLSGMGICLRADGDDDYSMGTDDTFGWSFEIVDNGDGTAGGPFMAGRPAMHPEGDGTVFQNPGVAGTGLNTVDAFRENDPDGSTHCVNFGGYPANPFGSFFFSLRSDLNGDCIGCGIGDDRFEPNDDSASAAPITIDTYGALISNPDDDFFLLTVPPSTGVFVELLFSDATSDLDLFLIDVLSGSGLDAGTTASDNELCEFGNCDPMNAVDIWIRVDNFGGVCNEYDLVVEMDALYDDDLLDDNDTCPNAVPLPIGITHDLVVRPYCNADNGLDDGDYYSLSLAPGDSLTVDCLFDHDIADVDTVLYDVSGGCNGSIIDTGFSTTDNEHMSYTNSGMAAVDLIVRVDWFRGRSNTYTLVTKVGPETIGKLICLGEPNSVGAGARVCASGSETAADNNVTLDVSEMPNNSLGYFVVSTSDFLVVNPAGSAGNLCIASYDIGRYSGNVLDSGMTGAVSFSPDLTSIPIATAMGPGSATAMAGDNYNWQLWYRDNDMGAPVSNFSDAICIDFQ